MTRIQALVVSIFALVMGGFVTAMMLHHGMENPWLVGPLIGVACFWIGWRSCKDE